MCRPNRFVKPFGTTINFISTSELVRGFLTFRKVSPRGFKLIFFHMLRHTVVEDTRCCLACFWQMVLTLAAVSSWNLTSISLKVNVAVTLYCLFHCLKLWAIDHQNLPHHYWIIGLVKCINIFAFRLEVVNTFAVVTCLAPSRTFVSLFLMFVSTKFAVELYLSSPFVWIFVHLRTFLATGRFSLISEFWVILFKFVEELVRVALSQNSLTRLFDCSKTLQILIALSSVKLSSLRSNSWSFPVTVKTTLSLNIRFFPENCTLPLSFLAPWEICRMVPGMGWSRIYEIRWLHCHAGYSILPTLLKLCRVYL